MVSLLSYAQNEKFILQAGIGDFQAETQFCGMQSLFLYLNNIDLSIGYRLNKNFFINLSYEKWCQDPNRYIPDYDGVKSIYCGSTWDSSLSNYIHTQKNPIFLGVGVARRGYISPRFEYTLGIDINYLSIENYIVDTVWIYERVTGASSVVYVRGHSEKPSGWGVEFNSQLDFRLSARRPIYLGIDGSYALYNMTPRRIINYGMHIMYKFGRRKN